LVEQSTAAAHSLKDQASRLTQLVGAFKVNATESGTLNFPRLY